MLDPRFSHSSPQSGWVGWGCLGVLLSGGTPDLLIAHCPPSCIIFAFLTAQKSIYLRRKGKLTGISQNTACSRKRLATIPLGPRKHFCAKRKMMFWRKKAVSAPQTRLLYNANKACLTPKCTLIVMQIRLLRIANKASWQEIPVFFTTKRPYSCFHAPAELLERNFPMSKFFTAQTIFACIRRSGVPPDNNKQTNASRIYRRLA